MKKVWVRIAAAVAGAAFLLAGCGKVYENAPAETSAAPAAAAGEYAADDIYMDESAAEEKADGSETQNLAEELQSNRKLIKTVSMQVETESYDTLLPNVNSRILELGGYVESSDTGKNGYGEYRRRYANITARIPKDKADGFVEAVASESNVTSKTENVEDVTLQYVDIESHKKALETEEARLLELMEKAENIEDIVAIESRLSEIRYQKESYTSQMRTFDNQIDYTTIHLYIEEVQVLTPVEQPGAWARIRTGFVRSVGNVIKGVQNFAIEFVIAIPYLVVFGVIILAIVLIIRAMLKASEKKRKKFQEERRQAGKTKMQPAGAPEKDPEPADVSDSAARIPQKDGGIDESKL